MVRIDHLSFSYKKQEVFSSVSMDIKKNSIYGLLGENGVGKTTFLRLLCGLLHPSSGKINFLGYEPKARQAEMLANVYYLPEVCSAIKISPDDYASLYAKFYPKFSYTDFRSYLNELNINVTKKMTEMSHGQLKKSMFAFALACNTPLLLMDEPTNGMDIPSKSTFKKLIMSAIDEEKTFIISSHQVKDLENIIDPIIILERNQVLINNSLEEITKKLWFGIKEKNEFSLYSEPCLGGFNTVELNQEQKESRVDLEMLFNAAISNKELFIRLFIK